MHEPSSRRWKHNSLILPLGFLFLAGLGLLTYLQFRSSPSDRVKVSATNIPSGAYFVSFVAMRDGKVANMDWSLRGLFWDTSTMHPVKCVWSYQVFPDHPKVDWNAWVQWRFGDQVGVLTRMTDLSWQVFWFDPAQVPLEGRSVLFGNGYAAFDYSKTKQEPAPDGMIISLGLEKVRHPDFR